MFKSSGTPLIRVGVVSVAILFTMTLPSVAADSEFFATFGLGRPATPTDIHPWDIDISPNGKGLPSGQGTVKEGGMIYTNSCAPCHGPTGIEGPMPTLIGGIGTLNTDQPLKTVGSYWPFATTLFDYIYRAMPFNAPQSLAPQQVYAVVAWILFRNGIIEESTILNAQTLPTITMPNHKGFVGDARPDFSKVRP